MEIKRETKEWIKFEDFKKFLKNPFKEGWLTIYKSLSDKDKKQVSSSIFGTFIKNNFKEKSLRKSEWDFLMLYLDYNHEEVEPLIFYRNFHGAREPFFEIAEKFRHFFNLYRKADNHYYFLEESGEEIKVIDFRGDEIKINIKFLFEYLQKNNLILSLGFDLIRWHDKKIESYELERKNEQIKDKELIYSFYSRNENFIGDDAKSFSSICGKRYIMPPENFKDSMLEPKRKYEEFIIGLDKFGNPKYFTCEESKLANYFGANPGSPHFVKPIFFKKEVLDKYYNSPQKYTVKDGYLSYEGLWGIRIDNNLGDNVSVFLGDLGRLPYKEQLHWKNYNIAEGKISEPFFKRNFEAEFCSPSCPAEYFKERMNQFRKNWKEKFNWDLFKPLNKEDEHHWKTLRIPKKDNQKEFDDNVLSLIKIMIDSLNQTEMKKDLIYEREDRSIEILKKYLKQKHQLESSQMIHFLKNVQELRSRGMAHRKASDYKKYYSKFDKGDFSKTFEEILIGAIKTLNTIENKIFGKRSDARN
jgi:hypothetical protein